jgi:UDP-GlcNAc:undecaprenyl-phosphate/decaprenyl-phosphate GlcNAc-1-phosphate transferase
LLLGALLAFGVTLAACPVVLAGLRRYRVIDDPNWRSSHTTSVPRGGGIAIAIGATVALALAPGLPSALRAGLLVVGLGVGAVGLADDLTQGTSPILRLAAIVVAAAASLVWLDPATTFTGLARLVVIALCLGWVASYVNAFNFMDGINGISAGQVLVVAGQVTVAALLWDQRGLATASLIVAASALAFVPFNFPRARMFLGDVGSYLLGGLVAGVVIAAVAAGIPVEAAATGAALYAADTFVTLVRRVLRGEVWHEAHREHVYQRVTDLGLSHVAVTGLVTVLSTVCAALGIAAAQWGGKTRMVTDGAVVLVVISYVFLPAVLGRRTATARKSAPT